MTISYEWKIQQLEVAPTHQTLSNVIRAVHWRYVGTDGEGEDALVAEQFGLQPLNDPDPANFTAFESVTAEMVTDWVTALLPQSVSAMQATIAAQIEAQRTPALVAMQLEEQG